MLPCTKGYVSVCIEKGSFWKPQKRKGFNEGLFEIENKPFVKFLGHEDNDDNDAVDSEVPANIENDEVEEEEGEEEEKKSDIASDDEIIVKSDKKPKQNHNKVAAKKRRGSRVSSRDSDVSKRSSRKRTRSSSSSSQSSAASSDHSNERSSKKKRRKSSSSTRKSLDKTDTEQMIDDAHQVEIKERETSEGKATYKKAGRSHSASKSVTKRSVKKSPSKDRQKVERKWNLKEKSDKLKNGSRIIDEDDDDVNKIDNKIPPAVSPSSVNDVIEPHDDGKDDDIDEDDDDDDDFNPRQNKQHKKGQVNRDNKKTRSSVGRRMVVRSSSEESNSRTSVRSAEHTDEVKADQVKSSVTEPSTRNTSNSQLDSKSTLSSNDKVDKMEVTKHKSSSSSLSHSEHKQRHHDKPSKSKEEEKEMKKRLKYEQKKKEKLQILVSEKKLKPMEEEIKKSLIDLTSADIDKCIAVMKELESLELTSENLLRNPSIIATINKCRKYKGSDRVRQQSEMVYLKFMKIFNVTEPEAFINTFKREMERFLKIDRDVKIKTELRGVDNKNKSKLDNNEADERIKASNESVMDKDKIKPSEPSVDTSEASVKLGSEVPGGTGMVVLEKNDVVVSTVVNNTTLPSSLDISSTNNNNSDTTPGLNSTSIAIVGHSTEDGSMATTIDVNNVVDDVDSRTSNGVVDTSSRLHENLADEKKTNAPMIEKSFEHEDLEARIARIVARSSKHRPSSHQSRHHSQQGSSKHRHHQPVSHHHRQHHHQRDKHSQSLPPPSSRPVGVSPRRHRVPVRTRPYEGEVQVMDDDELHGLLGV